MQVTDAPVQGTREFGRGFNSLSAHASLAQWSERWVYTPRPSEVRLLYDAFPRIETLRRVAPRMTTVGSDTMDD